PARPTQGIDINFYIDASRSMRGFRIPPANYQVNQFTEMLDKADGYLKEAWPNVTIHYWKFGLGKPQPLPSIREFSRREALFSANETDIEIPMQHEIKAAPGQAQLKIILTDLFQNDTDVGRLATELGAKYLQNEDYGVGILGVRNGFSGVVS